MSIIILIKKYITNWQVYLKQNAGDANLTISELKEQLKSGSGVNIMQRMSAYSANITGSDSYW